MKKIFVGGMLLLCLTATSVRAEERPLSFGLGAGLNLSGITSNNNAITFDGFGFGFRGGLIVNYQLAESYSIRSGVSFDYRNMADNYDITEMAIDIPIMGYYHWGRFYVGAGLSIGIPFGHESDYYLSGDRASVDVGYSAGLGFMITPNLAIDLRGNNNFTTMYSSGPLSNFDAVSHTESIQLIYFFRSGAGGEDATKEPFVFGENFKFGLSAGTNLSGATSNNNSVDLDGFGMGFTWGFLMGYHLTDNFLIRSEVNFDYRNVGESGDISEFAIDIPVMGYYNFGSRFYAGAGLSVGFPIGHGINGRGAEDRAFVDVGYTAGLGFMITPNLAIDLRGNNNFTRMYSGGPLSDSNIFSHTESLKLIYFL